MTAANGKILVRVLLTGVCVAVLGFCSFVFGHVMSPNHSVDAVANVKIKALEGTLEDIDIKLDAARLSLARIEQHLEIEHD